jgi:hypothetical protein
MPVYASHGSALFEPVFFGILDDAKGIYPKVPDAKFLCHSDRIFERFREIPDLDAF